ncbi:hypothetical protein ZIOFF_043295 [Zingiber officinale]|uniref:Uncharacterized protein n=1 Tax=Zingiber officinale TaxID=94328 RepID=A0A8J5FT05_ZINOF|nr:hypothetical protein ZIOFF_043295 [Zingiber officinale]
MYEGDWLRGKPSGMGKFSWPSGATYEGEFRSGRMDGVGTFTGADGDTYNGHWATNRKHGFSSKSYANGDYYEGTLRCNLQGAMGVACGETATSTWVSGATTSSMATAPSSGPTATAASVSLATEKNTPRICIWDSNSEARDVTCDVVDSLESSLFAWPTTEAKKPGQTILKGHKNYDLMLNLQLGISKGKEQEKQVFWALTPLMSMSWANVGDDDDDDYYATTAPPQAVWGVSEQQHNKKVEETIEELKKKEMAELDALLHEMGIANKDSNTAQNETADKKQLEQSSEGEKKESVGAPSENRILKKKKSKKEKSSKEQEEHDQNQEKGDIEAEVVDATVVDVKERIKKG